MEEFKRKQAHEVHSRTYSFKCSHTTILYMLGTMNISVHSPASQQYRITNVNVFLLLLTPPLPVKLLSQVTCYRLILSSHLFTGHPIEL
jgi:hypothetical protein